MFGIHLSKYISLLLCLLYIGFAYAQKPIKLGKIKSSSIAEVSGITPYGFKNGYFWVHNDSGDGPYIYLIDSVASLKMKVKVKGFNPVDIEDIARFKLNGFSYLLLADIGNNLRKRDTLSLYIIEEPNVEKMKEKGNISVNLFHEIKITYADKRRDAEAVFVDPLNQQIYIVSKRDFKSTVFCLPIDLKNSNVQVLKPMITLPFTFATAADISPDGKYIVVKNLTKVYLWERENKKTVIEAFNTIPKEIPYIIEPQGEAVCFDLNNKYLYTISERPFNLDSYLYKYQF